jgi:hypothetical protein
MPAPIRIALLALAVCSCAGPPRVVAPDRVAHTVYFWLRDDAPSDSAAELIAFYRERVPEAPGVISVLCGVPRPSEREVVDDSFTVGTTVVFASAADETAWQVDPIHDELRERFTVRIERVQVYDTLTVPGG